MELKDYQKTALEQVKSYLEALSKERGEGNLKHAGLDAWLSLGLKNYKEKQDGLGKDLPNFCLKIPTGGGKTFLAVKSIDLINTSYLKKQTGLVLWVVPTNQIYKQTIKALRDREHPYRQHLDIASGGKTVVLEKTDRFNPVDVEENLIVMMLMLPSASRQNKETLRMFRDSGGFQQFFPAEDDIESHKKLLEKIPNLDFFGGENGFWGKQIKTSLGNALRILSPIIILDEGQKAYSETAQETLQGFNPSVILEFSATPDKSKSNILVDILGRDLEKEQMIKLDLHVINKASPDWKDALLASIEKRNKLEEKAIKHEAETGSYIRPICLIQVERTGKEQRASGKIHSEDVREYLTNVAGIPSDQVAVTSSELKEIEGVDLLSRDCPIRYIITKQALQEGWDCSFAYVLTILANSSSKNNLTQLVGRILRQPSARKTKIAELDESYVFTFRQKTESILSSIKKGFEGEGLGDLSGRIISDGDSGEESVQKEKISNIRDKFKTAASRIMLPVFVIKDKKEWREVNYEMDIASRIEWDKINIDSIFGLKLSEKEDENIEVAVSLSEDKKELIRHRKLSQAKEGGLKIDSVFLTRHLIDVVPNPWIANEIGKKVIAELIKRNGEESAVNNFVFIIEELKKILSKEKDRISKEVFQNLLLEDKLRFMVIGDELGFRFPKKISIKKTARRLDKSDGELVQRSLFDFIPQDDFNDMERDVAWYLEDQEKLFFWFRNMPRRDYAIQGWQKNKIYPDFIFTTSEKNNSNNASKIFVVETKGLHLKNDDTSYKQSVFDICNKYAKEKNANELGLAFKNRDIKFEVVFGDEWKRKLNEMLGK